MGGAFIERDTTLSPLSMVFKEMHLLSGSYEGSPAEPVRDSTPLSRIASSASGREHLELPEAVAIS
jgi:hypothetical protein